MERIPFWWYFERQLRIDPLFGDSLLNFSHLFVVYPHRTVFKKIKLQINHKIYDEKKISMDQFNCAINQSCVNTREK